MSNGVSDFGKNVVGLSEKVIKALNAVTSVIGVISSIWGSFNTLKSVLTALGVLSQTDEIAQLRQAIDQLWQDFQAVIGALDAVGTMRDVANQLTLARTELQNLSEFAPEDASAIGIDPVWDGLRTEVLDKSAAAVIALGSPAYWQRVYFSELVYHPPWQPSLPWQDEWLRYDTAHQGGLVFDYRLILPAYLEAISIRLTILVAVVKGFSDKAKAELNATAVALEDYFDKIRGGIMEVWFYVNWQTEYPYKIWTDSGANFGGVERYSSYSVIHQWPAAEYPWNWPGVPGDDGKFLVRFLIRTLARWKQLYNSIGLASTAATLKQLKILAGISPASISGPTGDWSLRELAQRLPGLHTSLDPSKLSSLRYMLQILQTFSPQPYTSLRAALAQ